MAHLEWDSDIGHVIAVKFDAVRVVEHRQHAVATRHPVEKGADISDHVRVELPSVSLTGYVSKVPLFALSKIGGRKGVPEAVGTYTDVELAPSPGRSVASALQGGVVQAGLNLLSGITSANSFTALVFDDDLGSRVKAMEDLLVEAMEKVRMVRFVDEARDYDDMVITGVTATRTQQMYGAAFQIELEQIKVVESRLTDLPVPSELRGQLAKAAGAAAAKLGLNDSVDEKKKSAALRLAQGLFNGVGFPNVLP